MKVIMLRDVKGVGRRFEEREVSPGYAANFLFPKKLAVQAGSQSAKQVAELKRQGDDKKEKERSKISESLKKLSHQTLTLKLKSNKQGNLFASINQEKLAKALKDAGYDIDASSLILKEPIKKTGTYEIPVFLSEEAETRFTLEVISA